jgi:hypothetical protein
METLNIVMVIAIILSARLAVRLFFNFKDFKEEEEKESEKPKEEAQE